jgi:hypothetical protein
LIGETKLNLHISKYYQNIIEMATEVYVKGTSIKFEPTQKLCVICNRMYGVCKKGFCSQCVEVERKSNRELTRERYREILIIKQYEEAHKHRLKMENTKKYEEMLVCIFGGTSKAAEMLGYCQTIPELPIPEELAQVMKEKWEPMLFFEEDAWKIAKCIHEKEKDINKRYEYTKQIAARTVDYYKFCYYGKPLDHEWNCAAECYNRKGKLSEEKLFALLIQSGLREDYIDKDLYTKRLTEAVPIDVADDKLCVICQDRESCIVSLLCGHKCSCLECCKLLIEGGQKSCPICRQDYGYCVDEKEWNDMKDRLLSITHQISWSEI